MGNPTVRFIKAQKSLKMAFIKKISVSWGGKKKARIKTRSEMWDQKKVSGRVKRLSHDINQRWECLTLRTEEEFNHLDRKKIWTDILLNWISAVYDLEYLYLPFYWQRFLSGEITSVTKKGFPHWPQPGWGPRDTHHCRQGFALSDARPRQQPVSALVSPNASGLVLDNISF